MTRAEFERQYQVIRKVSDGAVRTHHAFASTGTVVMVHEIDPAAGHEATALAAMMARLGEEERARILDVLEVEGATVIVTRFLLDHTSLRSWLEASVLPPATPPGPDEEVGEDAPAPAPGDLGPRDLGPVDSGPEDPDPEDPGTRAPDGGDLDTGEEPGEFTRAFRAQTVPEPPSAQPADADPPPPPAPPPTPRPPSPPPAAPEPPAAAQEGPGEFTRLFRAMDPPPSDPGPTEPSRDGSPDPTGSDAGPEVGGDGDGAQDSAHDRAHDRAQDPDSARIPGRKPEAMEAASWPESAPPPPSPGTPGEFTRMFRAAVAPNEEPADPAPSAPPLPPPPSTRPPPPPPPPRPPGHQRATPPEDRPAAPDPTPELPPYREAQHPPEPSGGAGPGEFTRVFGAQPPGGPPRETPGELRYPRPGERGDIPDPDAYRSRLGARDLPPMREDPPPPAPVADRPGVSPLDLPRPPAAPPPPGEYTRIIRAADRASESGAGTPPLPGGRGSGQPAPPGGGGTSGSPGAPGPGTPLGDPPISRRTMILGLVAVVVLAAVLILVFLLTGGDAGEESEDAPAQDVEPTG